jgi:glycogen debranching enzyme
MTGPFNTGEAALTGGVTTVEGTTFCVSDAGGDIAPEAAHGLFHRDARVLSRWQLVLDGLAPLTVEQTEAFRTRFVGRRAPDLLVTRDRLVDDGLRETVTVENFGPDTAVRVELRVAADFADLFAVKESRATGRVDATVDGTTLVLGEYRVTATGEPTVTPDGFAWNARISARGNWSVTVQVGDFDPERPARRTRAWRAATTTITAGDHTLTEALRRTGKDLGALRIDGAQPYVAAGAPWFMTLFGRDSLLTAWMALPLDSSLALGTLQTLAESQGTKNDPRTEEQPGRIVHELRRGPEALDGGRYYGTADATPLFVMLLAEAWRWGASTRAVRNLLPAADAALSWVDGHGDFVTYQRATENSLLNQGWKDSPNAINHADGRLATGPIALCEVQAYAYAAWLARAELADAFGGDATPHRTHAAALRHRFAERFWLPDRGWYAVALDGEGTPVDALTSNAAHCLWTGIATDEHAATLVARLSTPDMDTGYGLRTLASTMGAYNPMSYHNGSVWPHDTAIAVAGLLRYAHVPGAVDLAHRLATGLVDAAGAFGGRLPELYCGLPRDRHAPPVPFPTSGSPQAWASAAPLLLVRALLGLEPQVPRGILTVNPHLPAEWGEVTLTGLRLGSRTATVTATGHTGEVTW